MGRYTLTPVYTRECMVHAFIDTALVSQREMRVGERENGQEWGRERARESARKLDTQMENGKETDRWRDRTWPRGRERERKRKARSYTGARESQNNLNRVHSSKRKQVHRRRRHQIHTSKKEQKRSREIKRKLNTNRQREGVKRGVTQEQEKARRTSTMRSTSRSL